jgi:hypothetical protein
MTISAVSTGVASCAKAEPTRDRSRGARQPCSAQHEAAAVQIARDERAKGLFESILLSQLELLDNDEPLSDRCRMHTNEAGYRKRMFLWTVSGV